MRIGRRKFVAATAGSLALAGCAEFSSKSGQPVPNLEIIGENTGMLAGVEVTEYDRQFPLPDDAEIVVDVVPESAGYVRVESPSSQATFAITEEDQIAGPHQLEMEPQMDVIEALIEAYDSRGLTRAIVVIDPEEEWR